VTQLIDAVAYLHDRRIVHRDVKLANCLVFTSAHDTLPVVKLTDFGLSMVLPDEDHKLQIFCGTPSYMAPEIVQRTPYTGQPADMWSIGILIVIVLTGKMPFQARSEVELYKHILRGNFQLGAGISGMAKDLIVRLLEKVPSRRFTAKQAAAHPWCTRPKRNIFRPGGSGGGERPRSPTALEAASVDSSVDSNPASPTPESANDSPIGKVLCKNIVRFMCEDVLELRYEWLSQDLLRDRRNPVTAAYWLLWQQLYGIRAATVARQKIKDVHAQMLRVQNVDERPARRPRRHSPRNRSKSGKESSSRRASPRSRRSRSNSPIPDSASDDGIVVHDASDDDSGSGSVTPTSKAIGARSPHKTFSSTEKVAMAAAVATAAQIGQPKSQLKRKVSMGTWMLGEGGNQAPKTQAPKTQAPKTQAPKTQAPRPSTQATTQSSRAPATARPSTKLAVVTGRPKSPSERQASVQVVVSSSQHSLLKKSANPSVLTPNSRRVLYNARKNRFALIAASAASGSSP